MSTFHLPRPLLGSLLTLLVCLGSLLAPTAATAAPTVTFGAEFEPWAYYDEGGIVGTGLTLSGSEYEGRVAPLTSLKLHLPLGTETTTAGFPTCSAEMLGPDGRGPAGCPEGSAAGPIGSFTALVPFGSEVAPESGTIQSFFGPGGTLYLFLFGHSPVLVEVLAEGHIEAGGSGHGPVLAFNLPLTETVPGKLVSLTSLNLELGATREEAGGLEVSSVTLPPESDCPHGSFAWSADAGFNGGAATPVAANEADCMQSGSHVRSKVSTSLEASLAAPYENQPVTYTAMVHPSGGSALTGAVTFYEGVEPINGCDLIATSALGTATCTLSYNEAAGPHVVHAVFSGDQNYREASSAPITVTVQEGNAPPPEEPHEAPKESPHEAPKGGGAPTGSSTPSGGGVSAISAAVVTAFVKAASLPSRAAVRIRSLLRHGGLSEAVTAPEAGTLSVSWYYVPKGAKLAKAAKPLLVASGRVAFAKAGSGTLKLRLSAAGRKLLDKARSLAVSAVGSFTASGNTAVTTGRARLLAG